jgi:tetratricopeptide (TPR) repeat protein
MKFLFLLAMVLPIAKATAQPTDSLYRAAEQQSDGKKKMKLYYELASRYNGLHYDSMMLFAEKAYQLAVEYGDHGAEATALIAKGTSTWRQGDLLAGLALFTNALDIARQYNFIETEALALMNVGVVYNYLGDYPRSLEFYRKSQRICDSVPIKKMLPPLLVSIGGVYVNLRNIDQALIYWQRALTLKEEIGDKNTSKLLNNIGLAYSDKGEYTKALSFLFRSLNSPFNNGICSKLTQLESIGHTYYKKGNLDSAEHYLLQAVQGFDYCDDVINKLEVYNELGKVYITQQNWARATQYLTQSHQLGLQSGAIKESSEAAELLAKVYESLGNFPKALAAHKNFHTLSDSIFNLKRVSAFARQEASMEFELMQKNLEMSQKIENLKKEEILNKEVRIKNSFLAGLIIMMIVAFLIFKNFQRKKRYSLRLEQLNKEIEKQKEELIVQSDQLIFLNNSLNSANIELEDKITTRTRELVDKNTELKKKNTKLEEYAFLNSHKLRAPVASILGLVELFSHDKVDNNDRVEIVNRIKAATLNLDTIVHEIQTLLNEEFYPRTGQSN